MTEAERIAQLFDNDGQNWTLDLRDKTAAFVSGELNAQVIMVNDHAIVDESSLEEVCEAFCICTRSNVENYHPEYNRTGLFDTVWFFKDGSYIAESNGYWDLSEADGTSWNGHKLVEVP